ncbi:unnamed protein product [Linum trigynum]|uniref:Uncharacterized protein n=1 Tax=Linum trigynum TaxID=586398 RepID=A0AAV2DDI0_9ROSI
MQFGNGELPSLISSDPQFALSTSDGAASPFSRLTNDDYPHGSGQFALSTGDGAASLFSRLTNDDYPPRSAEETKSWVELE